MLYTTGELKPNQFSTTHLSPHSQGGIRRPAHVYALAKPHATPRSGGKVPYNTFATPPSQLGTCIRTCAGLTRG